MIVKAKTEEAYHEAAALPFSLPMPNMQVDVDDSYINLLRPDDFERSEPAEIAP